MHTIYQGDYASNRLIEAFTWPHIHVGGCLLTRMRKNIGFSKVNKSLCGCSQYANTGHQAIDNVIVFLKYVNACAYRTCDKIEASYL